ncbi:carbohydrate ABC transporter permease [Paenibacillus mendelii]|uniref:Carbohydrate ABC transporter permease n=1 Tax=Paenibacillus mendelii TaxID=206163 RepID=A0ABV6JD65_9BACL|nr:carbohydrate ABC transporter permease [Paenibacillus mendelii]MCQ6562401.1 carbohydrate ABC transporter permease [Paenibacillus mendelii]
MRKPIAFEAFLATILTALSLIMLAPLIHVLSVSLSSPLYAQAKLVYFWPKGLQFAVYKKIFSMDEMWRAMGVSVYITVFGTLITLALTSMIAFALSRTTMPGRTWIMRLIVLTFILPAPLIPGFLLVKSLNMLDTLWSLMIPGATSAFYVIIMRTFFRNVSGELFDAAKMDGCSEAGIYFRVVLPLSTAVLATVGLFHAVYQWNTYFSALIYIREKTLYPLQVLLQNLVAKKGLNNFMGEVQFELNMPVTPEMMSAGIIIFATVPILIVYPFLQRYFVKGAMLGSLKE